MGGWSTICSFGNWKYDIENVGTTRSGSTWRYPGNWTEGIMRDQAGDHNPRAGQSATTHTHTHIVYKWK